MPLQWLVATAILAWFNILAVGPLLAAGPETQPGIEALAGLEYKREVLMYCGISDPAAVRGFLDHQSLLIDRHGLSAEMTLAAASRARQAAHAEWQNRGLGGFRGWCRDEGSEYAAILRAYRLDSQSDSGSQQGISQ